MKCCAHAVTEVETSSARANWRRIQDIGTSYRQKGRANGTIVQKNREGKRYALPAKELQKF